MSDAGIRRFWDWFRARADKVRQDPGRHAEEISEMLGRLEAGLAWEMGGPKGGPFEFIVRSESSELRHRTHEIVKAAPPLEGWSFSSWRQPMTVQGFTLQVDQGRSFDLGKFSADVSEDDRFPFLHLVVSSPEISEDPGDSEKYAGYLALDAILGEKTVEDAVDSIEFRRTPPGKVGAAMLRDEVVRRLAAARGRPHPARTDQWAMMEGKKEGKPLLAMVCTGLGPSLVVTHPWRLDVRLAMKETYPNGIATSGELEAVRPVEDRLVERVESRGGAVWTHRTHDGERTTSFYVPDPAGLAGELAGIARDAGYAATVPVEYDPRWRMYREFVD